MSKQSWPPDRSPTGFLDAWAHLLGLRGVPPLPVRRGRKPCVPLTQVLPALTFHVMQDAGTWAEHLFQSFRTPLAAGVGRQGESEWALAQRLLAQSPKRALLLADRLDVVGAFAQLAQTACQRVGSHFLLRASRTVKARVIRRLADGSRVVGLPVRAPRNPNRIVAWLEVREIRVQVGRPGHRAHELRLWTTLRDPHTAPALELARVYASRDRRDAHDSPLIAQIWDIKGAALG